MKYLKTSLLAIMILSFSPSSTNASLSNSNIMKIYHAEGCSCCTYWTSFIEETGFKVEDHKVADVTPLKDKYGIPNDARSCHTAVIGDYVLEGHVPYAALKVLLDTKPNIKGLAVPGMPAGSPGMDSGLDHENYIIYSLENDGSMKEFMKAEWASGKYTYTQL